MRNQRRTSNETHAMRPVPILAAFLFTLSFLAPLCASGADLEPKGRDSASLETALRQASPGDTVRLPAETFELSGTIHLKSSVKLIGARQEKTIEVLPAK